MKLFSCEFFRSANDMAVKGFLRDARVSGKETTELQIAG